MPLAGDEGAKQVHLSAMVEALQGNRQSDVARMLRSLVLREGGTGRVDCLMEYLWALVLSQECCEGSLTGDI